MALVQSIKSSDTDILMPSRVGIGFLVLADPLGWDHDDIAFPPRKRGITPTAEFYKFACEWDLEGSEFFRWLATIKSWFDSTFRRQRILQYVLQFSH